MKVLSLEEGVALAFETAERALAEMEKLPSSHELTNLKAGRGCRTDRVRY